MRSPDALLGGSREVTVSQGGYRFTACRYYGSNDFAACHGIFSPGQPDR